MGDSIAEGLAKFAQKQGMILSAYKLVEKGKISVEDAAEVLNMTQEEFLIEKDEALEWSNNLKKQLQEDTQSEAQRK